MPFKTLIAHVDDKDPQRIQTLEVHQANVAALAKKFAQEFSMGDWGYLAGFYHDLGKMRDSFQSYIRKVSGNSPEETWHGEDKRHAFIGAKLLKEDFPISNPILSMIVMGHHSGLDNFCDYLQKMELENPDISYLCTRINLTFPDTIINAIQKEGVKVLHHLIRMLYSCLVDADFLDTEMFMDPENSLLRKGKATISDLWPKLKNHLYIIKATKQNCELNIIRQNIQDICKEKSSLPPGFFSLTVPTGGGKTISSLVWAMRHCITHHKKRIIIAIPYTSIITQTAQILRGIFGEENVLEHHSEVEYDEVKNLKLRKKLKLATENWDYPIIVTTNVRLIESMMSNKPSKCRKLHNIVNSVVILDEVQTLPLDHLQPVIDTLVAYKQMFGVSFLFTTASLPALEGNMQWSRNGVLRGIEGITELIPTEMNLHNILRRTRILVDNKNFNSNEISDQLAKEKKVLCIVNTRKLAKEIFENLPNDGHNIHLSRMMCSAHLKKSIASIKETLLAGKHDLRVVSTQLIEAGVDIDFPVVYRQKSGLDSILQAAGRCNREGKLLMGDVHVFTHEKFPKGQMRKCQDSFDSLGQDIDFFSPDIMKEYFIQLYSRYDNFDKSDIAGKLYHINDWLFEEASQSFRLIQDGCRTIYVNYDNAEQIIDTIKKEGPRFDLMRTLSKYSVNVYDTDFKDLCSYGCVEEIFEGIYFIRDKKYYNEDTGLILENHWIEEILVI